MKVQMMSAIEHSSELPDSPQPTLSRRYHGFKSRWGHYVFRGVDYLARGICAAESETDSLSRTSRWSARASERSS